MKKMVLVSHDPGGYDVISPTYRALKERGINCDFYPVGPSTRLAGAGADAADTLLQSLKNMLDNNEISMLVTGTSWGNDIEVKCIALCNQFKIPTVAVLDYWSNYKMRFLLQDKSEYVFPTKLFVMDEIAYEQALEDGIDKNILEITGSPGLDKYVTLGGGHLSC